MMFGGGGGGIQKKDHGGNSCLVIIGAQVVHNKIWRPLKLYGYRGYPTLHLEGPSSPVVLILKNCHTPPLSLCDMGIIKWIIPCGHFPSPVVVMISTFCGSHFTSGVRFSFSWSKESLSCLMKIENSRSRQQ